MKIYVIVNNKTNKISEVGREIGYDTTSPEAYFTIREAQWNCGVSEKILELDTRCAKEVK